MVIADYDGKIVTYKLLYNDLMLLFYILTVVGKVHFQSRDFDFDFGFRK